MPKRSKNSLVLSIAPSPKGIGFAVMEGDTLVDWGVKRGSDANHAKSLLKVKQLMAHYHPDIVVLEDHKHSRRSQRIRRLMREVVDAAASRNIEVRLFKRERIYATFLPKGRKSKNDLAEILVERFPDELGFRMPPKRRDWMSEDHRMVMFDAVALGLMVVN